METAARYVPGAAYEITGSGADGTVNVDPDGRLTFPVDLGAAHTADEGTPAQLGEEAASGGTYWVTRTVQIAPS